MHNSRQIQRYQKCVIRNISILKRLKKQCETQGESVYQETVTDKDTFGFQLLSQTFEKFFTTLHNIFHQDFYPSWEIFTRAALAPLAPFSTSARGRQMSALVKANWFSSESIYV